MPDLPRRPAKSHEPSSSSGDHDPPHETQKRLSVDIPGSLHKAVKIRCADEECDIRDVVIDKLTGYVNNTECALEPDVAKMIRKKFGHRPLDVVIDELLRSVLKS